MEPRSRAAVRKAWVKVGLMLAFPVLFLVWVIVVVPATAIYDRSHQVFIECTVQSARLYEGSKRYVPFRVIIETEDCGPISVARGVTAENQQELADDIEPGQRYEFRVGKFERDWWGPLRHKTGASFKAEAYYKVVPAPGQ
ncbi:hypothetical protein GCM10025778_10590 [Paeniglutamicibacter antarcticus]|uniref:Uncharacterized protein n=1 Tax=Paeniglutamicibacter antarcticus TaxID=494023 RepID=A0ABP9TJE7_9MICC